MLQLVLDELKTVFQLAAFVFVGHFRQGMANAFHLFGKAEQFIQATASFFPNGSLPGEVGVLLQIAQAAGGVKLCKAEVWLFHPGNDFHQGRFACPVGSDQRNSLSGADVEGHSIQDRIGTKVLSNVLNGQQDHGRAGDEGGIDVTPDCTKSYANRNGTKICLLQALRACQQLIDPFIIAGMLHLQTPSPGRWLTQVSDNIEELLIDHAHCEKKAAGTAMNLLFAYVDNVELCREMTEIVQEELSHFHMVLDILQARGMRFRKIRPSNYGPKLSLLIDKQEPRRAVDRLLVAALIEARSCERFSILRDHLPDSELATFYGSLFESEARHFATYVRLAKGFAPENVVEKRLDELAAQEAVIVNEGDDVPRVHS